MRIEKILCTVLDDAHERQVEETMENLSEGAGEVLQISSVLSAATPSLRDCPKSLGRTCSVALRVDKEGLLDPFRPPYTSQIHDQSIARTLVEQSLSAAESLCPL